MFTTIRHFCFCGRSGYVQEKFKESLALLSLLSPTFSLVKMVVLSTTSAGTSGWFRHVAVRIVKKIASKCGGERLRDPWIMTKRCWFFFSYQTAVVVEARMQVTFLSEERDYTDQNVIGSCKWCMSTHFIFLSEGDCVTAAGLVSVNNRSQYLNTLQHPQENKKSLGLLTVGLCVALLSWVSPAGGGLQGCGHMTLCSALWGCRQGSWGEEEVSGWCLSHLAARLGKPNLFFP